MSTRKTKHVNVDAVEPKMALQDRLVFGEEIGVGGMCEVREAFDNNLLRTGAIKLLHPELADDLNTRRRMIEEAQIMAQLDHPNIVPVYELGETREGNLFFTMKEVVGQTLADIIEEQDFYRRAEGDLYKLIQYMIKVCDAVAFAHSHGVVHRDLKPENIMVGDFGEVYLMDWGIAKLRSKVRPQLPAHQGHQDGRRHRIASQDGKYVGTPHYMSPEQAHGDHKGTDERSDVFALGAILYELLVQVPPFDGDDLMDVLAQAARCEIVPPQEAAQWDLPTRLCQIAMKAVSVDPADRYPSVLEFKQDLERFLQSGWHFEVQEYEPGTLIIEEGDVGNTAYVIVRGQCRVYKYQDDTPVALADLGPGDVFGETAVFADEPRNASVQAIERVCVRVVPREFFKNDMGMGLSLGLFVRALARRFNERSERALELSAELDVAELFHQIFKYLMFTGEPTDDGRQEARWSSLCDTLAAQYSRDEAWLLETVQADPQFEVDVGRDMISVGRY